MLKRTKSFAIRLPSIAAGIGTLFSVTASCNPLPDIPVQTPAVPVIESQGKQLSHLIFSGGSFSLGEPKVISTSWTHVVYSGVAPVDDSEAMIQINLGGATGEIVVRNCCLTEDGDKSNVIEAEAFKDGSWSKNWTFVASEKTHADVHLTTEGLGVLVSSRTDFPWDVQLTRPHIRLKKGAHYTVSFDAKASNQPWPVTSYLMRVEPLRIYASQDYRDRVLETATEAVDSGVNILSILIPPLPWDTNSNSAEMDFIQEQIARVVAVAPSAKLILRFSVEPPGSWRRSNRGELLTWESGRTGHYVSICSEIWQAEVRERVAGFVKAVETRWGNTVIGYAPSAQSTGEWYYPIWDSPGGAEAMNFSKPFRLAYQAYLKGKYAAVERLNAAWHSSFESFDQVAVPSGTDRMKAELAPFRNPATQLALFDFNEFQQIAMVNAIENVAGAIKAASGGRKLVLPFYGYLFELPGCQQGIQESGHLALGHLLRSSNVDGVMDIVSYRDRGVGESGSLMTPVESVLAHGKLLITEDDSRTYLSSANAGYERAKNARETVWNQSRNLLRSLIHNGYMWMFDLYGQGWFNDRALWGYLGRLNAAYEGVPPEPYVSDVAVVVDEKSFLTLRPGVELTKPLVSEFRAAVSRTGMADPSWWLLEDWAAGIVPRAKLTVFLNAFYLTDREREAVLKQCSRNGGTVLWLYAPGYLEETGPTLEGMRELTGFRFQRHSVPISTGRLLHPLSPDQSMPGLDAGELPRLAAGLNEYFSVEGEPGVTPVASLPNSPDQVALAITEHNGFRSVFCAAPQMTTGFLSELAQSSGVWRYAPAGNIVLNNGHLLGVTCPAGGSISIVLPKKASIHSLAGSLISPCTDHFTATFQPGETKIFLVNQ